MLLTVNGKFSSIIYSCWSDKTHVVRCLMQRLTINYCRCGGT